MTTTTHKVAFIANDYGSFTSVDQHNASGPRILVKRLRLMVANAITTFAQRRCGDSG